MAAPQMVEVMVGGVAAPVVVGHRRLLPAAIIRVVRRDASSGEVVVDLAVPAGAVVTQVNARGHGRCTGAHEHRRHRHRTGLGGEPASSSTELVIDFGGLRTVSSLEVPGRGGHLEGHAVGRHEVRRHGGAHRHGRWVDFQELQTERPARQVDGALSPAAGRRRQGTTTTHRGRPRADRRRDASLAAARPARPASPRRST